MTKIFAFGSLDLTDKFGIESMDKVKENLRPYIYVNPKNNHYLLNLSLSNKKDVSQYGYTHDLMASKKGTKERVYLVDLKEYDQGNNAAPAYQQPAPQRPAPQQPAVGADDLPF